MNCLFCLKECDELEEHRKCGCWIHHTCATVFEGCMQRQLLPNIPCPTHSCYVCNKIVRDNEGEEPDICSCLKHRTCIATRTCIHKCNVCTKLSTNRLSCGCCVCAPCAVDKTPVNGENCPFCLLRIEPADKIILGKHALYSYVASFISNERKKLFNIRNIFPNRGKQNSKPTLTFKRLMAMGIRIEDIYQEDKSYEINNDNSGKMIPCPYILLSELMQLECTLNDLIDVGLQQKHMLKLPFFSNNISLLKYRQLQPGEISKARIEEIRDGNYATTENNVRVDEQLVRVNARILISLFGMTASVVHTYGMPITHMTELGYDAGDFFNDPDFGADGFVKSNITPTEWIKFLCLSPNHLFGWVMIIDNAWMTGESDKNRSSSYWITPEKKAEITAKQKKDAAASRARLQIYKPEFQYTFTEGWLLTQEQWALKNKSNTQWNKYHLTELGFPPEAVAILPIPNDDQPEEEEEETVQPTQAVVPMRQQYRTAVTRSPPVAPGGRAPWAMRY